MKKLIFLLFPVFLMSVVYAAPQIQPQAQPTPPPAAPAQPAAPTATPAPVAAATPSAATLTAGKTYTITDLLTQGYAVEVKRFTVTESVPGAIGKAAVWKDANFFQGVFTTEGTILIKGQMSVPKNSKLLSSDWTGG